MTYIVPEKGVDVTGDRFVDIVYQNTTDRPLKVSISGYGTYVEGGSSFHDSSDNFVSDDNIKWSTRWGGSSIGTNTRFPLSIVDVIPPGYYYKLVSDGGSRTIQKWIEANQ